MAQNEALLDLATPRTIQLHDRGRMFYLICGVITKDDWLTYFNGIRLESEQDGKSRVNTLDMTSPLIGLAEAVLESAEGYKASGADKLTDLPNWQKRIPLPHRIELGKVLTDAKPSAELDEFVIHAEGEEVSIDATWSYKSEIEPLSSTGGMQKFSGLKHIFKTPPAAQHKRYQQQVTRSIVVGGSRTGKTIYASTQPILCELYDELILQVDGYSVRGEKLTSPEVIRREMDSYHKFIAAQELFAPQSQVTTESSE